MSVELEIRLLGGFAMSAGGFPLAGIRLPRQQELIAYLLLHPGQPQARGTVAARFWPDASEPQGRNNLRQLLHDLRHAVPDLAGRIKTDHSTLSWSPDPPYLLDVDSFELLAAATVNCAGVDDAVATYGGDLLPECYEEWILPERARLQQLFVRTLERGMMLAEAKGDYRKAIEYGDRLLAGDPLREDVYASLLRFHWRMGDRAGALLVYHACAGALDRELGVVPGPELTALYDQVLASGEERPLVASRPSPGGAPAAFRPSLVGRSDQWARLQELWDSALNGASPVAVITGDPGIGKSRLAQELQGWLTRHGVAVYRASCHQGEESLPFSTVKQLLSHCPLGSLPSIHRERLAVLTSGAPNSGPGSTRADSPGEGWQKMMLFESISVALLSAKPVLIVVDDLQWIDTDSMSAIERSLRSDLAPGCLFLATCRTDAGQSASAQFRDSKLGGRIDEIDLCPLSSSETKELAVQQISDHGELTEPEAATLYRETEGNPLFVVELLRGGWRDFQTGPAGLPHSLQNAVHARFRGLSAGAQELLGLAAVVGTLFRLPILTSAARRPESELIRDLDELWRQRIVREGDGDSYVFSHGQLREAAYAALTRVRRIDLHNRVADAYREHHGSVTDAPAEMARHLAIAGRHHEAGTAYVEAAAHARIVYAYASATSMLGNAIDLLGGEERIDALIQLGEVQQINGDWAAAEAAFRQALADASHAGDRLRVIRCRLALGDVLRLSGRFSEALAWLESLRHDLEESPPEGTDRRSLCKVMGLLADIMTWLARYSEAEMAAREQLRLADEMGDGAEAAVATASLATVFARRTEYDEALIYYRQSLAFEERLNDVIRLQAILGRLGNLHRLRGEFDTAQELLQRQLALAQESGYVHSEGGAAANLGGVLLDQEEWDSAIPWMRKSLAISRRLGDRQREAATLGNLGVALGGQGDLRQACGHLIESIEMQTEVGDRRNAAVGLTDLGEVYTQAGHFSDGLACLTAGVMVSVDIDNRQNAVVGSGLLAQCFLGQGELLFAETFANWAVSLARRLSMSRWLAVELHTLALVLEHRGDHAGARNANSEAMDLLPPSRNRRLRLSAALMDLRLTADLDPAVRTTCLHRLRKLFREHDDSEDVAAIAYDVWLLDPSAIDVHKNALHLCRQAYERAPRLVWASRIHQLTGEPLLTQPTLGSSVHLTQRWHGTTPEMVLNHLGHLHDRLAG